MERKKISRPDAELIQALQDHIDLLREFHNKAFNKGDSKYLGEVAGKLRLLVYRSPTCKPLLRDLMDKFNTDIRLDLSGPGNRSADIDEYFNQVCGAFRSSKTGDLIKVTRMNIVRTWAQQIGSSHEDSSVDEDFAELLNHGLFVNSRQIAVDELRRSSQFVLAVADAFLQGRVK